MNEAAPPPLPERPDLMQIISDLHTRIAALEAQNEFYRHYVEGINDAMEDHA